MTENEADIITRVRSFLTRFIAFPNDEFADILAVWIVHTWAFDAFRVTPYIYLNSAERGSGKTLTLELLNELCRNATMAADISAASLYRFIEAARPTMLVDEVDAIWSGAKNEDLRGVLNSGYKHNGKVMRAGAFGGGSPSGDDDETVNSGVVEYSTFCPKVLAGIDNGQMPDTIADRSLTLTLRRANRSQMAEIEDFYIEDEEDAIEDLKFAMKNWSEIQRDTLRDPELRPARLPELGPRQNEIARPLLTVARCVNKDWHDQIKDALLKVLGPDEVKLSQQATALLKVREWFSEHPTEDKITSATVSEIVGHSGKQIGVWFNAYGIRPFTTNFASLGGKTAKGYRRADFAGAWDRYLPATDAT